MEKLLTLYKAHVRSQIKYCVNVCNSATKSSTTELKQKRAVGFINNPIVLTDAMLTRAQQTGWEVLFYRCSKKKLSNEIALLI